jgi:hypothetical protein
MPPFMAQPEEDAVEGSTSIVRGTATTSWVAYPSTATTYLSRFSIDNDVDNPGSRRVWVSLNSSGTDYTSLAPGDSMEIQPNNTKQIYIRCNSNTAVFSLWYDLALA